VLFDENYEDDHKPFDMNRRRDEQLTDLRSDNVDANLNDPLTPALQSPQLMQPSRQAGRQLAVRVLYLYGSSTEAEREF